ncbi:MAG: hypothetical protein HOP16_08265 [Acidobacteria bacterium]|nr:hypothetical protein [Acidobacteriota bacterium]
MKLMSLGVAAVLVASVGVQRPTAHHSVPVNFDQSREITVTGVLTEIKWVNPHAHFRINVTNPDSAVVEWLIEMGAANTMRRAGFPMDRFMVGDRLTIIGNPGRRDRTMILNETVLPDGTHLTPTMRPRDPTGAASSGE